LKFQVAQRVLTGILVAWPALAITLSSEESVFRIVEYYVPHWVVSAILIRVVAGLLFFLSLLILTNSFHSSWRWMLVGLVFPLVDNVFLFAGGELFASIFLFSDYRLEAVAQIFALITASIILVRHKNFERRKPITYIVLLLAGLGLTFIKPVYIDDWNSPYTSSPLNQPELNTFLGQYSIDVSPAESVLIVFVTTSCSYCVLTATKLGISQRNEKLPKTVMVFPGTKDAAESFLAESALNEVSFILTDHETFLKYAGNTFPSLYFATSDKTHHWTGSNFGYRALSLIEP